MSFRLQSRHIALTYPQCTSEKETLYEYLLSIRNVERVLVAQELHADDNIHYHCYVRFRSHPRVHITNPSFFDFEGHHPNFQGCRNTNDWIQYCIKEDENPLCNFSLCNKEEVLSTIISDCQEGSLSTNDIFKKAVLADPKLLLNGSSLITSIKFLKQKSETYSYNPRFALSSFSLSPTSYNFLFTWGQSVTHMTIGDRQACKSLWFYGNSMLGKSALARSIGIHWYMQGAWNLSKISDKPNIYGVIDDVPWETLRYNYKGLLGRQVDVTFTDKYCKKKELPMGFPVIVCTNTLPDFEHEERLWLRANINVFCIDSQLLPGSPTTSLFPMNL